MRHTSLGVLIALLAGAPLPVLAQQPGGRLDTWRDTWGWWALESQREMAIDEPISNVMHIEGHNAFNSTAYDAFHTVPVAGPNQILRIDEQLDAGARAVELDVHHLREIKVTFCLDDNPLTMAKRIWTQVLEPLSVQVENQPGGTQVAVFAAALATLDSIVIGEIDDFGDVVGALRDLLKSLADHILDLITPPDFCADVKLCFPGRQEVVPNICTQPGEIFSPLGGDLFVAHESEADFTEVHGFSVGVPVPVNGHRKFIDAVEEIAKWLKENEDEVVLIDLEDGSDVFKSGQLVETLVKKFKNKSDGSSMIYTALDREADGQQRARWPTRREMLEAKKRVVIFDSRDYSFENYETRETVSRRFQGSLHEYNRSDRSFRRDGGGDGGHGNWFEKPIQKYEEDDDPDIARIREEQPDNEDQFFAVSGDGLTRLNFGDVGNENIRGADVAGLAQNNVNVIKMDFLLGSDVGALEALEYKLPLGPPGARMQRAVWSWREDDRAVFRARGDPENILAERDYVVQIPSFARWQSSANAPGDGRDFRYACISAERERVSGAGPDDLLEYLWRITERRGPWIEGNDACREEFEQVDLGGGQTARFVFAGPVNGHRNFAIREARRDAGALDESVWLNVNDVDEDGFWLVNRSALALAFPAELTVPEGTEAQASVPKAEGSLAVVDETHQHVFLDGLSSFDPDAELRPGDALRGFSWTWSYADPKSQGIVPSAGTFVWGTLDPAFPDDGVTTVELFVTDGHPGGDGRDRVPVTVINVPPETAITALEDETGAGIADKLGVAIEGLEVSLRAIFSDAGRHDSHTGSVDWADGTVSGNADLDDFVPATAGEGGELAASHPYLDAGEYEIRVTVTDDDRGAGVDLRPIEVVSSSEAMERGAALLTDLLTDPGTSADAASHLEEALRRLLGNRMGRGSNGAFDLLAGGEWNAGLLALVRAMGAVEAAREAGLAGDPRFERAACFLTLGAKSVAAKQLLLLVNDQSHPQDVAIEASVLIAEADILRESGDLSEATDLYRLAHRAIQGFTVPGP